GLPLRRPPDAGAVADFYVGTLVRPAPTEGDELSSGQQEFTGIDAKVRFRTADPGVKAAFAVLYEAWPKELAFEDLWARVQPRRGQQASPAGVLADLRGRLLSFLVYCFLNNLVELHTHAPPLLLEVRERPVARPLARLQARQGQHRVTSLSH